MFMEKKEPLAKPRGFHCLDCGHVWKNRYPERIWRNWIAQFGSSLETELDKIRSLAGFFDTERDAKPRLHRIREDMLIENINPRDFHSLEWFLSTPRLTVGSRNRDVLPTVSIWRTLRELYQLPWDTVSDSFIGFRNLDREILQFLRWEYDLFIVDIPIVEEMIFLHSFAKKSSLNDARKAVIGFFQGVPRRKVFNSLPGEGTIIRDGEYYTL